MPVSEDVGFNRSGIDQLCRSGHVHMVVVRPFDVKRAELHADISFPPGQAVECAGDERAGCAGAAAERTAATVR